MYYTIYETTNTLNGKKYIGKHVTSDLYDNYIGPGCVHPHKGKPRSEEVKPLYEREKRTSHTKNVYIVAKK